MLKCTVYSERKVLQYHYLNYCILLKTLLKKLTICIFISSQVLGNFGKKVPYLGTKPRTLHHLLSYASDWANHISFTIPDIG